NSVCVQIEEGDIFGSLSTLVLVISEPKKIVEIEEDAEDKSMEISTVKHLLDEVDKQNKAVQKTPVSPYDTESEIKVVKSYFTSQISKLKDQIMYDSDESVNYKSMPKDDLRSVSGFEGADSDNTQGNDVSHSDHTFPDCNAFAERLSLPEHLDHICEEVSSLHSKLGIMESFNIHQSDRFAKLETKPSKTLKTDMGNSVTTLVKSGMQEVRDDLKSQAKSLGKFSLDVQSMQTQLHGIQSLLESAVIVDDTAKGEKNKKAKDPNPTATQGSLNQMKP
nr:hypothetical protein [Tanacetum cinerariifolium]